MASCTRSAHNHTHTHNSALRSDDTQALSRLHGNFVAVKKLALDKDKTGTLMVCSSSSHHTALASLTHALRNPVPDGN